MGKWVDRKAQALVKAFAAHGNVGRQGIDFEDYGRVRTVGPSLQGAAAEGAAPQGGGDREMLYVLETLRVSSQQDTGGILLGQHQEMIVRVGEDRLLRGLWRCSWGGKLA